KKKSNKMTVSLIISTYNWPEALEKSLKSAFYQTVLPNEIIIADDGSARSTKNKIDQLRLLSTIPVEHVWHADKGFRLSAIRNEAIAMARYDYVIQIDGDIIMAPHFIEDHLRLAQERAFLCGSRVLMPKEYS